MILTLTLLQHYDDRDEFHESRTGTRVPSASGVNPYASMYETTDYAARDSYGSEQQYEEGEELWNSQDVSSSSNRYY